MNCTNPIIIMRTLLLLVCLVVANSHLSVYSPPELAAKFSDILKVHRIPYSIANFGTIPYGKTMMGEVIVANPMTNCEFEEDISQMNSGIKQNKFLLTLRGECTFSKKVSNAQAEGNQMAIVMDNVVEKTERVVMASDGLTEHLKIPSIFISETDGQIIVDWITANPGKGVILSIKFETNVTDIVDIGFWLNANNRASYSFIREFKSFYDKINIQVKIEPYYYTYVCNSDFCSKNDCFADFRYCASDPDGPLLPGTGQTIILEQLRQYFIFKTAPQKWWEYMNMVDLHCAEYGILNECSNQLMEKIGISSADINNQVSKSFLNDTNPTLQAQSQAVRKSGVIFFPDVTINSIPYHGDLEAIEVFELACNSINKPPSDCNSFVYDQDKIVPAPVEQSHALKIALISSISIVVFFIFMVCIYRRIVRRKLSLEINNQVNQLVSQYITLYETNKIEAEKMEERM